ncbi:hypothetical protein SCUCBS95973_004916 [Sporothrix curviconia]|uniref:Uncharacterized protein n=1 Tax=Sporothrix curviconia TaxID=1260050 RepID=A0ABP0BUB0_9PEZI
MPFETRLFSKPGPKSAGRYKLPYVRPPPSCRTFNLSSLETLIDEMRAVIHDPDLFRLFENTYPNTLDTMIKWHGYANKTNEDTGEETVVDEELTYIITGDIDAMWLRDSAAQMQSYSNLLVRDSGAAAQEKQENNGTTLAQLWRGLINLQARYVLISPYCHSFQPPRESGIPPTKNPAFAMNHPFPRYEPDLVFDCKWELDSLASFLQISATYFEKTGDISFFGRYRWMDAVEAAVSAAAAMRQGMYDEEGHVLDSAYIFTGWTDRGTETLNNFGLGNPSRANGMVRTSFRPSDDATIFQFLVPANMMLAASLERASDVMETLSRQPLAIAGFTQQDRTDNLTAVMRDFAIGIRQGIATDAIVKHRVFGDIFAYEVDGYGSANLMDDANIPSLLSIPLLGFLDRPLRPSNARNDDDNNSGQRRATVGHAANHGAEADAGASLEALQHQPLHPLRDYAEAYANTRRFVLSKANPYFAWGEPGGFAAVGGPHMGPGKAWPMASIVTALTMYQYGGVDDDNAHNVSGRDQIVADQLGMLLNSTWGAGVMHESIDTWSPQIWTRPWFGWANGLFGELVLAIAEDDKKRSEDEKLLSRSWQ